MSEFQLAEDALATAAILNTAHYSTVAVTMEAVSHDNTDHDETLLPVGTPVALISGGTEYKPVRRDTVASVSYDSSAGETTVTLDNSAEPFLVGDTCQSYDGVDGTATSLGAITEVDYDNLQIVFDGDQSGNTAADEYLDVTETGQGNTALILLEPCEMWSDRLDAAVDRTTRAIIHGVIVEDNISQVQDEDAQLEDDLSKLIELV